MGFLDWLKGNSEEEPEPAKAEIIKANEILFLGPPAEEMSGNES